MFVFFFKQKTAYEMRISDWSSDVCSSDLLIEKMKPNGGCEFLGEFARVMPVTMFLRIVDLPLDRREEFVEWGIAIMSSYDPADRMAAQMRVREYLKTVLDERDQGDRKSTRLNSSH